jgi:hypothetical protein
MKRSLHEIHIEFDAWFHRIGQIESLAGYDKCQRIIVITNKHNAKYRSEYYEFDLINNDIDRFWMNHDHFKPDYVTLILQLSSTWRSGKSHLKLKYIDNTWKHY